ncbi:MAG: DUF433 domain-containing protein [Planctomycetaceae bacterium]|nr:DUF433 domain-containing protein [Planctomycetaceae bacterium]
MTLLTTSHIELDDSGRAWVAGTRVKVLEIVLDHVAYGFSPAEIHLQHPHLSLAQIHAALSYYYDHQVQLDVEMQRQSDEAARLRDQDRDSPGRRRLRAQGLLP